jgi:hypothetical protein
MGQLGWESHQEETNPSASTQPVCRSQIHPRKQNVQERSPKYYIGTCLADQHSGPLLPCEFVFLVQPMESSALLMLETVTDTSNSVCRKFTISYRYNPGFSCKYSHRASSIGGVTLLGRPPPFEGAFVEPKQRRFLFIAQMERLQ